MTNGEANRRMHAAMLATPTIGATFTQTQDYASSELRLTIAKAENGFVIHARAPNAQSWKAYVVTDAAELTGMMARIAVEATLNKELP